MEGAVRRAREAAGVGPPAPPDPTPSRRPERAAEVRWTAPQRGGPDRAAPPSGRPDRWLVTSVLAVAALVVIAAIALAVSLSGSPSSVHRSSPPARTLSTGPVGTAGSSPTSTTTVPVAPAGPPVISSLTPSSGAAGQGIEVAGANFLSTSGQIVATFNGRAAPTSCPAQNTCSVTVPPSTSPSAEVVITTASGTSNAVLFTYG